MQISFIKMTLILKVQHAFNPFSASRFAWRIRNGKADKPDWL